MKALQQQWNNNIGTYLAATTTSPARVDRDVTLALEAGLGVLIHGQEGELANMTVQSFLVQAVIRSQTLVRVHQAGHLIVGGDGEKGDQGHSDHTESSHC